MQLPRLFVLKHSDAFLQILKQIIMWASRSGGLYIDATKEGKHSK